MERGAAVDANQITKLCARLDRRKQQEARSPEIAPDEWVQRKLRHLREPAEPVSQGSAKPSREQTEPRADLLRLCNRLPLRVPKEGQEAQLSGIRLDRTQRDATRRMEDLLYTRKVYACCKRAAGGRAGDARSYST